MLRLSRSIACCALLSSALVVGCHSNKQTTAGPVTVSLPNGTTQVIPAGQPIPVGATVVADGSTRVAAPAAQPVAPATTTANAPVAPQTVAPTPVPASPAPSATAPAPVLELVVPSGTHVSVRTTETLSAERSEVGAPFSGVLNAPVTVRGTVAFTRGTSVRGEVTSAKGRGRFKGAGVLGITLTEVGGYRVQTSEYVVRSKGRGKRTAGFIGGGGGIGALIGGLAGGGKGALIGGLAGAGAGTAAGSMTGNRDVVIPSESAVGFRLEGSIRVKGR